MFGYKLVKEETLTNAMIHATEACERFNEIENIVDNLDLTKEARGQIAAASCHGILSLLCVCLNADPNNKVSFGSLKKG